LEALRQEVDELPEQVLSALNKVHKELLDKLEQVRQESFSHAHKAAEQEVKLAKAITCGEGAEKQLKSLEAGASLAQELPQVPSLISLIAHCESGECEDHAAEWNDVKAKIIARVPDDYIKSRAAALGMVEKPKEPKTIRVAIG